MPKLERPDGFVINYDDRGDRDAPAVVLLHGFTSDLRMWAPHAGPFAEGYRVIAPDLRGHGETTAPPFDAGAPAGAYTMEAYADDLSALLDALEVDVCALAGSSFGGMVALQFATTWPGRVAALVLSDTSAAYADPGYDAAYHQREAEIDRSTGIVERFGTAELGKRAAARLSDPFLAAAMRARYALLSRDGYLGTARVRRERPNLLPILAERLAMPVLICIGEDDPVRSASEVMASSLPHARVVTFAGAGHGVPVRKPEAYGRAVLAFLRDVEEGRPTTGRRRG